MQNPDFGARKALSTRTLAATLVLLGMGIIGFIDNFVSVIAETASLWQFHFLRALMSLPLIMLAVGLGWGRLQVQRWRAVLPRSIVVAGAMFVYFGALGFMTIAQALAGLLSGPIFVLILGALFLGQRFSVFQACAAALGFAGGLLVLQPTGNFLSPMLLWPILGGFLYAVGALLTRETCAEEETLTLLFCYVTAMAIGEAAGIAINWDSSALAPDGSAGYLARAWGETPPEFWFWTAVQAVGSLVAVWCLTRAYQMAPARLVSVLEYSLMVFGPLFAALLFAEIPNALALMGLLLIMVSGFAMTYLEHDP